LIEICDKKPEDCRESYAKIWEHKQIIRLLSKQDENGLWNDKDYGHQTPMRYLTALAEYGLCKDERIDRYVEYSIRSLQTWSYNHTDIFACIGAMALRALVMLGYHERGDVMELIAKFAEMQLNDGGFICGRLLDKKPERKSCYKSAISGLLLYAECKRKNILPVNADNLVNYFLKREILYSADKTKAFYDKSGSSEGRVFWEFPPLDLMRIGVPLLAYALSVLGAGRNPAMQETWEVMKAKQDEAGRLPLEGAATRLPCNFGMGGQANKWATFYAILADKYRYGVHDKQVIRRK
jgi:hypothetical protein